MNKALYFPTIRLPEGEWLTRTLLYWDQVGSIIPGVLLEDRRVVNEKMIGLINHGLLTPLNPSGYIDQIPQFKQSFITLLDRRLRSRSIARINQTRDKLGVVKYPPIRIHIEKMGVNLSRELVARKLAVLEKDGWFLVERYTADLLMTFLACALGKLDEIKAEPVTDNPAALGLISPLAVSQTRRVTLRMEILESILPIPRSDITLDELVRFKAKYGVSCRKFRTEIENELITISNIPHVPDRKQKTEYVIEQYRDQIAEIEAKMKENNWKNIIFGSIASVIPVVVEAAQHNPAGAIAGLSPFMVSLAMAYGDNQARKSEILSSPIAYAAIVGKKLS